jgi:hypothetical protein
MFDVKRLAREDDVRVTAAFRGLLTVWWCNWCWAGRLPGLDRDLSEPEVVRDLVEL